MTPGAAQTRKPYYQDDAVTIYHGDCREIAPTLPIPALVLTDPPYGVSEPTDRLARGRGKMARCNDFPPVHGDDEPFDPALWLTYPRVVLFGANHFADKLPASPSWLVWDKRDGVPSNDNADCELAWTNIGGPARLFRHLWSGMLKASEGSDKRVHPTQKPVALMAWIIARWTEPGDLILDPYMGSGPTLRAAKDHGRRAIGIEYEERSGSGLSVPFRRCSTMASSRLLRRELFSTNTALSPTLTSHSKASTSRRRRRSRRTTTTTLSPVTRRAPAKPADWRAKLSPPVLSLLGHLKRPKERTKRWRSHTKTSTQPRRS